MLFQLQLGEEKEAATSATSQLSIFARDSNNELETKKRSILLNRYWQDKGKDNLLVYLRNNYFRKFLDSFREWSGSQVQPREVREEVYELFEKMLGPKQQRDTFIPQPQPKPMPPDTDRAVILEGKRFPVTNVFEIFMVTAEWLIQRNHLQSDHYPIALQEGATNYIIHSQPIHGSGRPFIRKKQLSNGLYAEVNWNKRNLERRAHFLLQRYGYPPETLKLDGFSS